MTQRQVFPPLALRAEGLSCGRSGNVLSHDLSFTVPSGQCLFLRGPNGAGKSTLLLTLAGIVRPLDGAFALDGADEDVPLLHYCGHRNAIKQRLSVRENLHFWRRVNGETGATIENALETVGLGKLSELDAGFLSAGQTRRLALARLLVSLRPLWLLDEPTAALDTDGHALVARLVDEHLRIGGMVVAATHDPITLADPEAAQSLVLGARA
jgi:heme exporter protein A